MSTIMVRGQFYWPSSLSLLMIMLSCFLQKTICSLAALFLLLPLAR
jgi:hypothetical protein